MVFSDCGLDFINHLLRILNVTMTELQFLQYNNVLYTINFYLNN